MDEIVNQRKITISKFKPGKDKGKIVDGEGVSLRRLVFSSNLFPRDRCMREDCPLQWKGTGCQDKCHKKNIRYVAVCKNVGLHKIYIK